MDGTSQDTTPEILAEQIRALRQLDISARAAVTFELSDNLRQIVRDGVRHRHPDYDDARVRREALRIVLGDRLFEEAFPDRGPGR